MSAARQVAWISGGTVASPHRPVNMRAEKEGGLPVSSWFRRQEERNPAPRLYLEIVEQARRTEFYETLGVPDTLDGRFEMIVLHMFLIVRRLRGLGENGAKIGQALFDAMFADMDRNLREMGVGDLGVGRRVKKMAERFYGSVQAYDRGLEADADEELQAALGRNVFAASEPPQANVAALAAYLRREAGALDAKPEGDLLADPIGFGEPPNLGSSP